MLACSIGREYQMNHSMTLSMNIYSLQLCESIYDSGVTVRSQHMFPWGHKSLCYKLQLLVVAQKAPLPRGHSDYSEAAHSLSAIFILSLICSGETFGVLVFSEAKCTLYGSPNNANTRYQSAIAWFNHHAQGLVWLIGIILSPMTKKGNLKQPGSYCPTHIHVHVKWPVWPTSNQLEGEPLTVG